MHTDKQEWMKKGQRVIMSGGSFGTINTVIERTVVHHLYITPDGVENSWPYNPSQIKPIERVEVNIGPSYPVQFPQPKYEH